MFMKIKKISKNTFKDGFLLSTPSLAVKWKLDCWSRKQNEKN